LDFKKEVVEKRLKVSSFPFFMIKDIKLVVQQYLIVKTLTKIKKDQMELFILF